MPPPGGPFSIGVPKSDQEDQKRSTSFKKKKNISLFCCLKQRLQNIIMPKWATGISERKKELNLQDQGFQLEKRCLKMPQKPSKNALKTLIFFGFLPEKIIWPAFDCCDPTGPIFPPPPAPLFRQCPFFDFGTCFLGPCEHYLNTLHNILFY